MTKPKLKTRTLVSMLTTLTKSENQIFRYGKDLEICNPVILTRAHKELYCPFLEIYMPTPSLSRTTTQA
jgi:hypothetical protein